MAKLTPRDQRTIRIGAIIIVVYLIGFMAYRGLPGLGTKRDSYQALVRQAETLRRELKPYEEKVRVSAKLMTAFNMDPAKLTKATLVAQASSAIQKSAMSSGIAVGPLKESSARSSSKELASVQFQGSGSIQGLMTLLHKLEGCGFPLLVDSVQITQEPMRPGMLKFNLSIIILDFDQWKRKEASHA